MSEYLYGIEFPNPPEGWTALEAVVLLKGLNPKGTVTYIETKSPGLTAVEALGMATTFTDSCREMLIRRTVQE